MVAAYIGLAGFNPMEFLSCKDQSKVDVLQAVARAAAEIREQEAHNLAVLIVNKLGESLK